MLQIEVLRYFLFLTVAPWTGHPRWKSESQGQKQKQLERFWGTATTARGLVLARLPTKLDKVNCQTLFFFVSKLTNLGEILPHVCHPYLLERWHCSPDQVEQAAAAAVGEVESEASDLASPGETSTVLSSMKPLKQLLFRRESEERGNKGRRGVDSNSRSGGVRPRKGSKGREASGGANSVERRPGSMERAGELRGGQRLTRQLSSSQDSLLPSRERRCSTEKSPTAQDFCESKFQVLTVELRGPIEQLEGLSPLAPHLSWRQRLWRVGSRARAGASCPTFPQPSSEKQLHRVGGGGEGGEAEDSQCLWNEQIHAEVEEPPVG